MQKFKIIPIFTILAVTIIMGMGYFSIPEIYAQTDKSKPFTGIVINAKTVKPFNLVATVMEINPGDSPNVVVAEKIILVTEYKLSGKIFRTQLINNSDRPLALSELEIDQRVIVTGLELPDKTIVGQQIQVKPK
jgi:hypothetical protein